MTGSAMRIGLVVPRFAPYHGGVELVTEQAAAALAAKGAEVTVVTQVPRGSGLPTSEETDGYLVERHCLPFGDSFDVPSPAAARAAWRSGRFDVVWVHNYHTPLAWLVAERTKAPVVLNPYYHGGGHTRLRAALHPAYRPAGRRLMAASRRIMVLSDVEADLVMQHFPRQVQRNKITVVPPAVADPVRGGSPYQTDLPVVLTVARQAPYKRTDLLVRAFAELRSRAVRAQLVVIGDGPSLAGCRDLAVQLGVDDVVTFTGAVDDATLSRWWATASVYATASLHEAFGVSMAEALVAGLAVVASGIPAHREVLGLAGPAALAELCPPDSKDPDFQDNVATSLYADAMERFLDSPGDRGERAARCDLPRAAEVADRLFTTLTSVIA
jgi:glycosyltransferase involved in cell wall biosynthesis